MHTYRNRFLAAALAVIVLAGAPVRAHAVSKEIIQLQTQVQQLLDMVQRLQTTLDTRFAVLQNLAQQTADQAVQMSATVNALQQKMNAENEAISGKLDTNSGQIQSLNDSVDELKTRIAKLEKIHPGHAKPIAEHSESAAGRSAWRAGRRDSNAGCEGCRGHPGWRRLGRCPVRR